MATPTKTRPKTSTIEPLPEPTPQPAGQRFEMLPLAKLKPAPDNPRRDVGDVSEMAASMRELGVLEPFVTVQQNGHYLIVAGHRRYAAAAAAGLLEVPAIIRELTDEQRVQAMLIENLQREDLTPLEEGRAYKRLVDEFGVSQRALAAKVGRSQGHISKRMGLLGIPKEALAALDSGGITIEDAQELARIKDPKRALNAWKMRGQTCRGLRGAVEDELSAIQRDELVTGKIAELEKIKARAIPMRREGHAWLLPKGAVKIEKNPTDWSDSLAIDPIAHASEPCHAIGVRTVNIVGDGQVAETVLLCTDRKRHPKAKTGLERRQGRSSTSQDSQAREHREIQKARGGRLEVAAAVAVAGVSTDVHKELVFEALIGSAHQEVLKLACRMLGLEPADKSNREFGKYLLDFAAKSPQNQRRAETAIAFGTHEEGLGVWYDWSCSNGYFDLLENAGYEISDIERKKLKRPKAAA